MLYYLYELVFYSAKLKWDLFFIYLPKSYLPSKESAEELNTRPETLSRTPTPSSTQSRLWVTLR